MKQFIVLYYAPTSAMEQMADLTPEQMQANMAPWMAWMGRCGENLVDAGSPLGGGLNVAADGAAAPSGKNVTGYSILQAQSMTEAQALLAEHPHFGFGPNCEVEIHEAIPIGP